MAVAKQERVRRERLAEQVADYCDRGYASEDAGLIEAQAFGRDD